MKTNDSAEWEILMLRLDTELNEVRMKGNSIEEGLRPQNLSDSLLTLMADIGNHSNIEYCTAGLIIITSCIQSYFNGEMTRNEFIKTMVKPSRTLVRGAEIYAQTLS